MRDRALSARIEDGELCIRIGIDTLSFAIEMNPDQGVEEAIITDADVFAAAIAESLMEEEEDGTTPIELIESEQEE